MNTATAPIAMIAQSLDSDRRTHKLEGVVPLEASSHAILFGKIDMRTRLHDAAMAAVA